MTFFILAGRSSDKDDWVGDFSKKFEAGADAQAAAKEANERNAHWGYTARYRVRKVVDTDNDNFLAREAAKNLTKVPWEISHYYAKHAYFMLPHIDPEDDKQVRFFLRLEDAVEGRYTSLKMSTYLYRHEDFNEEQRVRALIKAGFYTGKVEFGITTDAELIQDIYNNGPTSCMNDPEEYCLPDPHPAIVYSKGDLAVAYLRDGTSYTARGVVYPEKKVYHSIYGHSELLSDHLEEEEYTHDSSGRSFDGAKIAAIRFSSEWLMPYVDACCGANLVEDGDESYFVLQYSGGEYDIRTTEGYAYNED